jgi:hypothetical protein
MYTAETESSNPLRGAAAGAIGGILGSAAMVVFNHALAATGFGHEDLGEHHQHRRVDGKPNDSDGTVPDEPASRKAAARTAEALTGETLDERQKDTAGSLLHYGFGAAVGAVYGAIAAASPRVTRGGGAPYGAAVFLTATEIGVPLAGLSRHPAAYPAARHAASLASHLVYGVTLECVRRLLMRHTRARAAYDFASLGV